MENCLVKQYKVSANNPNLEYFNAIQVKVDWTKFTEQYFYFTLTLSSNRSFVAGGEGVIIKPISNCLLSDNGVSVSEIICTDSSHVLRASPVDATIPSEFILVGLDKITMLSEQSSYGVYVKNPNRIKDCSNRIAYGTILNLFGPYPDNTDMMNIDDSIKYFSSKEDIKTIRSTAKDNNCYYLTTSALKDFVNLTNIDYYARVSEGNISELANLTKMADLQIRQPGVYGDIASLGKMTMLTALNLNDSNVGGTVEDFVKAQCNNGRTTASNIAIRSRKVTYLNNGTPTILGGAGRKVSWNKVGDNYNITVEPL